MPISCLYKVGLRGKIDIKMNLKKRDFYGDTECTDDWRRLVMTWCKRGTALPVHINGYQNISFSRTTMIHVISLMTKKRLSNEVKTTPVTPRALYKLNTSKSGVTSKSLLGRDVPHVTAWAGGTKYQADGFLFDGVYIQWLGYGPDEQTIVVQLSARQENFLINELYTSGLGPS